MHQAYQLDVTGEREGLTPPRKTALAAIFATLGVPVRMKRTWHNNPVRKTFDTGETRLMDTTEVWEVESGVVYRPNLDTAGVVRMMMKGELSFDKLTGPNILEEHVMIMAGRAALHNREMYFRFRAVGWNGMICYPSLDGSPALPISVYRPKQPGDRPDIWAGRTPTKTVRIDGESNGPHWRKVFWAMAAVGFPAVAGGIRDDHFVIPSHSLTQPDLPAALCTSYARDVDDYNAAVAGGQLVTRPPVATFPGFPEASHPFHVAYQSLHSFDQLMAAWTMARTTAFLGNRKTGKSALIGIDAPDDELQQAARHTGISL